ncbi:unnamed protein product, partial [Laminaria digitata]
TAAASAAAVPASNGSNGKDGSSTPQAASDSSTSCFLYMSESRFDPVKRRFGGKSKPVTMANPRDVTGRGARLSFGPAAKVVATKEAMHTTLHCRCVFVLLREVSSEGAAKSSTAASAPSSQGEGRAASERGSASRSRRTDTAHLIALSPDDLFLALSVNSFPLVASVEREGNSRGGARTGIGGGGGGGSSSGGSSGGSGNSNNSNQRPAPAAASALSRAFEIMDGPVVVHRPPSRLGEPWRGLEVYRPEAAAPRGDGDRTTRPWRGQRIPLPPGLWQGQ